MSDRFGEALPGATYNGFSRPAAPRVPEAPPPPAPRTSLTRSLMYAGLALAVGTGLAFGLWARPELANTPEDHAPMKAAVQTPSEMSPAEPQIVPVEVLDPIPTPAPKAAGPLEVLPDDLARRAEAARPVAVRPPPRATVAERPRVVAIAPPPRAPARSADTSGSQVVAIAPAPPPVMAPRQPAFAPAPRQARNEGPAFNCRYARSQSERLVCGDAELAQLDRRLNSAFNRAVSSGIPFRELRAEQDDWLNIREDAARRSPDAVASIYRQRIRELNAIAEDGEF